jgi:ABC-type antimicrobial peptide transport system permease subunit
MGDLTLNEVSNILKSSTSEENTQTIAEHGIQLPSSASTLSLWINPGNLDPQSRILGRIRDASGYYFDILFGYLDFEDFELDSKGWVRLDADIFPKTDWTQRSIFNPITIRINERGQPSYTGAIPPFTLQSIRVDIGSSIFRESGAIFIGELIASGPLNFEGERMEDHNSFLQKWHIIDDLAVPGLFAFEYSSSVTPPTNRILDPNTRLIGRQSESEGSAVLSWIPGGISTPSIAFGKKEIPMPSIVSKSLLEISNAQVGDTLTIGTIDSLIPIKVIASTDYFPTLDPMELPFVVTDLTNLNHYTNLRAENLTGGSNEIWVRMLANESGELLAENLSNNGVVFNEIFIADDMVSKRVDNPLVNAGWGGLLLLMFFALVLASASGVMLYSYTDSIERKSEYAVLRTLGFTKSQLNGVVWFNVLLVMIFGISIGTIAGYQIGYSILPLLEITEGGVRVTPPMILTINWSILFLTYLILGVIASITILWLSWITNKMDIQSVLRIGDN